MRRRPAHSPGAIYHLTLRGNRKAAIFEDPEDWQDLTWWVARSLQRHAAGLLAWCWMPNHLHLLLQVGEAPAGQVVHGFAGPFARRFNWRHGTVGHLFQGRYFAKAVATNAYLLTVVRYIHRNPLEAGLVQDPARWGWSSAGDYQGRPGPLPVRRRLVLDALGEGDSPAAQRLQRFTLGLQEEWQDDTDLPVPTAPKPETASAAPASLDSLCQAAAAEFGLPEVAALRVPGNRRAGDARCWVAAKAMAGGTATLGDVARHFGLERSAMSRALARRRAEDNWCLRERRGRPGAG